MLRAASGSSLALIYRLRWLMLTVWVVGFLSWWSFYIGPALEFATRERAFRFFDPVLLQLSFYWTRSPETWRPGWGGLRGILGYRPVGARVGEIVWASVAVPAGLVAALLWGIAAYGWPRKKEAAELPATRQPHGAALAAASVTVGLVGLAVLLPLIAPGRVPLRSFGSGIGSASAWWVRWIPVGFLLVAGAIALGARAGLRRWSMRAPRYWQLERLSFAILLAAGAAWAMGQLLPRVGFGRGVRESVAFLATTVLLWAWGCRVILLFRLRAFERALASRGSDRGECFACGYDLRGTISAGRRECPECGAPLTPSPTGRGLG